MNEEKQTRPGRVEPCCAGMTWSVYAGYIKIGYLWSRDNPPAWIPWTFKVKGVGFYDVSPIRFCPFCGVDLNKPAET